MKAPVSAMMGIRGIPVPRDCCCSHARIVPPDHAEYGRVSGEVFAILRQFTPSVEGLSVDEAFLDISGLRLHYDSPADVGRAIRERIRTELGLPASVGGSAVKFLAKLASEAAKPDGLHIIPAGTELDFLHPLPVRSLWGVGEATHAALEGLGVTTIGDLAAVPPATLQRRLGAAVGAHLHSLANARDPRPVVAEGDAKSISVEETYQRDLVTPARIGDELFAHCEALARRLRNGGYRARTVTLKVRFDDFTTVTRSVTLPVSTDRSAALREAVGSLLAKVDTGRPVRLLGVGGSHLETAASPEQTQFGSERDRAVADAADRVRRRYGDESVVPARLAPRRTRVETKQGSADDSDEKSL